MTDIDVGKQAHLHTREAAFFAPFFQALGTGFFVALAVFTLLEMGRIRDAWRIALVVFVLVATATWLGLQYRNLLLTTLEKTTGKDLNGDGIVGTNEATAEAQTINVWISRDKSGAGYAEGEKAEFSASLTSMRALAKGLLAGRPFTQLEWAGKEKGKLMSLDQFRTIRREMLYRHLLREKIKGAPNSGYELTHAGREMMRQILAASPSPQPDTYPESG